MKDKFAVSMFGQKRLSREGGIEIVVKELCTRMARDGCQVTCYNRSGHHVSGAEYDDKIEYDGIRQKFVPTIERKGLAAVSSSFFAALYSAFGKYDVVHIHAEGPAFFAWLPKLFGKRVVVTIHGIDWKREKWKSGFGSKFIRQGEKNAVKYADEIIILSKGVQDYFKDTYGRKTHFIPNGVNRPEIRKADLITEKFELTKDSYILFLGRLVPEKGIRYLVEAFKDVKTDKKLVIAGGSSDTDSFMKELKKLAKDDDRIIFTGFVQGQMLDELYSNAYIYTLPSDLEGMPCNGTKDKEIMGNLNNQTWDELWNSPEAEKVRAKVRCCDRDCWMIGSVSPAMHKYIWKPATWVLVHKFKALFTKHPYSMYELKICRDYRDGKVTKEELDKCSTCDMNCVINNGLSDASKEQLKHKTGEEIVDADIAQQLKN